MFIDSFKHLYGEGNVRPLADGRIIIVGQHWATFDLLNVTTNTSGACVFCWCVCFLLFMGVYFVVGGCICAVLGLVLL